MKASVTKVSVANRCLRKYKYMYVNKIEKIVKNPKPTLGVIGHESLKELLKGNDWTTPIVEYEAKIRSMEYEEQQTVAHIPSELYRLIRGYIKRWQSHLSQIEPISIEEPFEVETPGNHICEGIMDLVYKDKSGIWVEDHKFVGKIPADTTRTTDMQTNIYYSAATLLGYAPTGIIFDYIRTKAPSTPRILKNGTVSKAACDTDVQTYLETLRVAGLDSTGYEDVIEKLKYNIFYERVPVARPQILADNMMNQFDITCNLLESIEKYGVGFPACRTYDCVWNCPYYELCTAEFMGQIGIINDLLDNTYQPRKKQGEEEQDDGE